MRQSILTILDAPILGFSPRCTRFYDEASNVEFDMQNLGRGQGQGSGAGPGPAMHSSTRRQSRATHSRALSDWSEFSGFAYYATPMEAHDAERTSFHSSPGVGSGVNELDSVHELGGGGGGYTVETRESALRSSLAVPEVRDRVVSEMVPAGEGEVEAEAEADRSIMQREERNDSAILSGEALAGDGEAKRTEEEQKAGSVERAEVKRWTWPYGSEQWWWSRTADFSPFSSVRLSIGLPK